MKTRTNSRRIISVLLVIAMMLGLVQTVAAEPPTDPTEDDGLILVWEADLEGATSAGTGRNYVSNAAGQTIGFVTSSSANDVITIENGTMKFTNTHTSSNIRLHIIAKGTGSGSPSVAGFEPEDGKVYRVSVNAENATQTAPLSAVQFRYKGVNSPNVSALEGTSTFVYDFTYDEAGAENDGTHGRTIIAIDGRVASGATVYYSDFKIYEVVCPICQESPCICPCDLCGTPGCKGECRCDWCGQYPCEYSEKDEDGNVIFDDEGNFTHAICDGCDLLPLCQCRYACQDEVIAKWDFSAPSWATDLPGIVARNVSEDDPKYTGPFGGFDAPVTFGINAGLEASMIYRHHDLAYPDGSNASSWSDNTQSLKHMDVTDGWLRTGGWSTAHNYIYLKLNTKGFEDLILTYDIRSAGSTSSPASLKLQYSFDRLEWKSIAGGDVPTRPGSTLNVAVPRREHLPESVYDQEEVYIRWFGTSGSTSGRIEFRNITLISNPKSASPEEEDEQTFTHINLAPGQDAGEIGFAWFTPKGYFAADANKSVLEIVKVQQLVEGEMPANPVQFHTTNGTGSTLYDTNKVVVKDDPTQGFVLEPDTEYAYRVGDGTAFSKVYTFKTQNPDGKYDVMVVADPQVSGRDQYWKETLAYATAHEAKDAAFILSAGDQTNEANDVLQIEGYVNPPELRSYPVAAAYGNRDHDMPPSIGEQIRYLPLIYNWPENARAVSGEGGFNGHDYYFAYGDALYIVLDSNVKNVQTHRAILQAAVNAHPDAKWRVALFHHDIYGGSRHAGSYYGDSAVMQSTWSPLMSSFDIDIVFNGHDHLYARSYLYKNNAQQKYQMTATFDQDLGIKNPSAVVLPEGTQYMALATPGSKFYELEMQDWVAYADEQSDMPEYSVMTIDGDNLVVNTYRRTANGAYTHQVDSITLRKKATREDLEKMLPGAKLVQQGSVNSGWGEFQAEITAAQAVINNSSSTETAIHDAYVAVYEAFYALTVSTDKSALNTLIKDVTTALTAAREGEYLDQYPRGSKDELQKVLDSAILINEKRLATEQEAAEATAALQTAFDTFKGLKSSKPIPWKTLHPVSEDGESVVDLIGWMKETTKFVTGDKFERYDSNLTKQNFASDKDSLGQRTDPLNGPHNSVGGRGNAVDGGGHISRTHIGEWIRYELDVEKDGLYDVKLGAKNATSAIQTIFLRDTQQNILATFEVPANHEKDENWADAALVPAKEADGAPQKVYLPKGKTVIELFFKNNGVSVTRNTAYTDGADVDILTFERVSDGTPPEFPELTDDTRYYLDISPLPPLTTSSTHSQRGWGSIGYTSQQGGVAGNVPATYFKAATHLVLEVAGDSHPTGNNLQLIAQTDGDNFEWRQAEIKTVNLLDKEAVPEITEDIPATWYTIAQKAAPAVPAVKGFWDGDSKALRFDLSNELLKPQANALGAIEDFGQGWLGVCYYSTGWNELNVMRAYLQVDPTKVIPACEKCGYTGPCTECPACKKCDKFCTICTTPGCGKCDKVCTGHEVGCKEGSGGKPCWKVTCTTCNPNNAWKLAGDPSGDGKVDIFDCLEILKFLIKMDCTITKGGANITIAQAEKAAIISSQGVKDKKPTIFCVLEILKFMIKMESEVDGQRIFPKSQTPSA